MALHRCTHNYITAGEQLMTVRGRILIILSARRKRRTEQHHILQCYTVTYTVLYYNKCKYSTVIQNKKRESMKKERVRAREKEKRRGEMQHVSPHKEQKNVAFGHHCDMRHWEKSINFGWIHKSCHSIAQIECGRFPWDLNNTPRGTKTSHKHTH